MGFTCVVILGDVGPIPVLELLEYYLDHVTDHTCHVMRYCQVGEVILTPQGSPYFLNQFGYKAC